MGTRSIQLASNKIQAQLPELQGKMAHAVLLDGKTYSGKLGLGKEEGSFSLEGQFSSKIPKLSVRNFQISEIRFLIYDELSPW